MSWAESTVTRVEPASLIARSAGRATSTPPATATSPPSRRSRLPGTIAMTTTSDAIAASATPRDSVRAARQAMRRRAADPDPATGGRRWDAAAKHSQKPMTKTRPCALTYPSGSFSRPLWNSVSGSAAEQAHEDVDGHGAEPASSPPTSHAARCRVRTSTSAVAKPAASTN